MTEARVFQALSDPTRLKIVRLLGSGTLNVGDIVARLACAQPLVSRHLRVLKDAGLIENSRRGKFVEYSLRPAGLDGASRYLLELREMAGSAETGPSAQRTRPGPKRSRSRARPEVRRPEPSASSRDRAPRRESEEMDDFLL
jgi:DNA-binding transcriptional ArsR family regulator